MRLKLLLPIQALFLPVFLSIGANLQLVSPIAHPNAPSVGGNGDSYAPIVTPDGRYVVFASTANNLVPTNSDGPINSLAVLNVFIRDRLSETTTLVSVSGTLGGADLNSAPTGISTNGRYALFESLADNLAPGCSNLVYNVYVRDLINNATTLVSVSTNGTGGSGNSYGSAITPDGRYVVFASDASNLVPQDTNGVADVFVRDLLNQTTTLVSTGAVSTGTWPGSSSPAITPDGQSVVFLSTATNLALGVKSSGEVYVRNLVSGTTTWASTNCRSLLQQQFGMPNAVFSDPTISSNGQWLAFEVSPTNSTTRAMVIEVNLQTLADTIISTNAYVDPSDTSMSPDGRFVAYVANGAASTKTVIYLWDAESQTNILVSADLTTGLPAPGDCNEQVINSSGTYLTFLSNATNLTANPLLSGYHLYLWNIQTGTLQLVDVDSAGAGAGLRDGSSAAVNSDGSLVAFDFALNNADLIPNDNNRGSEVFAVNPATHATELISGCLLPAQTPNNFVEFFPSCISTNGRYVAFASEASDLADNITNDWSEVFVRDLLLQTNILASADTNGFPASSPSTEPSISADGRYVAFSSYATNLTAGVFTNSENVFLRDLQSRTTALASAGFSSAPWSCGNDNSYSPTISSDGRYIMYYSQATNVAEGLEANKSGGANLILRDNQLATNYALTTGISWPGVLSASMTPDGRYIAFVGAINQGSQSYLYVWNSQTATLIYTNASGNLTNVCISPDGSWIAYEGASLSAMNLQTATVYPIASGGFNSHSTLQFSADDESLVFTTRTNVYVYNFQGGTNLLVNHAFNSTNPANGISKSPAISPDGRFVAYRSTASNIVPNDADMTGNVYLYDRINSATTLISVNLAGNSVANNLSAQPEFSGDGGTLAFLSYASDLAGQDFNEFGSVFALNLASSITNSTGTNVAIAAQISGITAPPGQYPATGNPVIVWQATAGVAYQVQFADNLSNPVWQNVTGNMILIGNNGQIMDLSPNPGQRFYRIVMSGQ
ncbi:MAG TPA: hypothetical protein VH280_24770 [Verrucomicrobiae bacterium]|jgi:Tol biopolymer transport system component|nr:hypothetical protein [Verrucomicrobiae bacterium]